MLHAIYELVRTVLGTILFLLPGFGGFALLFVACGVLAGLVRIWIRWR